MLPKYPRTWHLPSSPGATSDDKRMRTTDGLSGELVVTEKMDGGNITLSREYFHARSTDASAQPWDFPAKALWAGIQYFIPEDVRLSAESLYARRSVAYDGLPNFLMVFGAWRGDTLLPWEETVALAESLGLPVVPVLYRGADLRAALRAWEEQKDTDTSEGFVVRTAGAVPLADFGKHVGKWVRSGHVQTDASWRQRDDFERNTLA